MRLLAAQLPSPWSNQRSQPPVFKKQGIINLQPSLPLVGGLKAGFDYSPDAKLVGQAPFHSKSSKLGSKPPTNAPVQTKVPTFKTPQVGFNEPTSFNSTQCSTQTIAPSTYRSTFQFNDTLASRLLLPNDSSEGFGTVLEHRSRKPSLHASSKERRHAATSVFSPRFEENSNYTTYLASAATEAAEEKLRRQRQHSEWLQSLNGYSYEEEAGATIENNPFIRENFEARAYHGELHNSLYTLSQAHFAEQFHEIFEDNTPRGPCSLPFPYHMYGGAPRVIRTNATQQCFACFVRNGGSCRCECSPQTNPQATDFDDASRSDTAKTGYMANPEGSNSNPTEGVGSPQPMDSTEPASSNDHLPGSVTSPESVEKDDINSTASATVKPTSQTGTSSGGPYITESQARLLNSSDPLLTPGSGFTVRMSDLETLQPGEEIDNALIDAYAALIVTDRGDHTTATISSHFLRSKGLFMTEEGVMKRTADGYERFEYEVYQELLTQMQPTNASTIFFPIHYDHSENHNQGHYILIRVQLSEKSIEVYDSLPLTTENRKQLTELASHVYHALYLKYGFNPDWKIDIIEGLPLQDNNKDCGAFVIRNMTLLLNHEDVRRPVNPLEILNTRLTIQDRFIREWRRMKKARVIPNAPTPTGMPTRAADFIWTSRDQNILMPGRISVRQVYQLSGFEQILPDINDGRSSVISSSSRIPVQGKCSSPGGKVLPQCAVCRTTFPSNYNLRHIMTSTTSKGQPIPSPYEILQTVAAKRSISYLTNTQHICRTCHDRLTKINNCHEDSVTAKNALEKNKSFLTHGLFAFKLQQVQVKGTCYHCQHAANPLFKLSNNINNWSGTLTDVWKSIVREDVVCQIESLATNELKVCTKCKSQLETIAKSTQLGSRIVQQCFPAPVSPSKTPRSPFPTKTLARKASERTPSGVTPSSKRLSGPKSVQHQMEKCYVCADSKLNRFMTMMTGEPLDTGDTISQFIHKLASEHGLKVQDGSSSFICQVCLRYASKLASKCSNIHSSLQTLRKSAANNHSVGVLTDRHGPQIPKGICMNCSAGVAPLPLTAVGAVSGVPLISVLMGLEETKQVIRSIDTSETYSYVMCFACAYQVEQLWSLKNEFNLLKREMLMFSSVPDCGPQVEEVDEQGRLAKEEVRSMDHLTLEETPSLPTSNITLDPSVLESLTTVLQYEAGIFIRSSGFTSKHLPTIHDAAMVNLDETRTLIQSHCPLLHQLLRSLTGNLDHPLSSASIILVTSLISESNRNCNLLKRLIGFILWKEGVNERMFGLFNHLKLSMSMSAIRNLADSWVNEHEKQIESWKVEVEESLQRSFPQATPTRRRLFEDVRILTTSLAYDNINYHPEVRHQGPFRTQGMLNWTIQIMMKNRIPSVYNPEFVPKSAQSVPLSSFLLSDEEKVIRDQAFRRELQNILCRNFTYFKDNKFERLIEQPQLAYRQESSSTSEYIPLGLATENEGSIVGNIRVLDGMTPLLPRFQGRPVDTVTHGNGATVNNIFRAKKVRATSIVPDKTLSHFKPVFGEFHDRMTNLDVYTSTFIKEGSSKSKGSLANIKTVMRMMGAESGKTFNHSFHLAKVTGEGLACLAFMEELGLNSWESEPLRRPDLTNEESCRLYLNQMTDKVMNLITFEPKMLSPEDMQCRCKKVLRKEKVVRCGFPDCTRNPYFHRTCNSDVFDCPDDGTFCSFDCFNTEPDRVQYATRALLHSSLRQLLKRESIRLNDANLMYILDKEDLIIFHQNHHFKYVGFIHNLILSQNGCVPPHVANDMFQNRTMNTRGKPGSNIAVDLFVEHNVGDVKDDLRSMPGNMTHHAIDRKTKLSRIFATIRNKLLQLTRSADPKPVSKQKDITKETEIFVNHYKALQPFRKKGSRVHIGFQNFNYCPDLDFTKFKQKMEDLSNEWDLYEEVATHFSNDETTRDRLENPPSYEQIEELRPMFCWDLQTTVAPMNPVWLEIEARYPEIPTPTDIQFKVAKSLMLEDTMIILPTAMGKSLCYITAGLMHHHSRTDKNKSTVVLIVSPLTSIIESQCRSLERFGLKGAHLTDSSLAVISKEIRENADIFFAFTSPETVTDEFMKREVRKWQPVLVVVDEAHLIPDWGKDFRPALNRLGELRALTDCRYGAMTGTCTTEVLDHLRRSLHMWDAKTFAVVPDRPNIYLAQRRSADIQKFYNSLCQDIKRYGPNARKVIIYVETFHELTKCYDRLVKVLKGFGYVGPSNSPFTSLIATFSGGHDEDTQAFVSELASNPKGNIRIIISTVSFGLGVDIPDISLVVHLGGSKANKAQRWQEAGRAGRRSQPAAYLTFGQFPRVCLRQSYLMEFDLEYENMIAVNPNIFDTDCNGTCDVCSCIYCVCCDFCAQTACSCRGRNDRMQLLFPAWNLKTGKRGGRDVLTSNDEERSLDDDTL